MEKWYIEFPTWKYKEDAVSLAKENDLEIVDAKFNGGDVSAGEMFPKLTLKEEQEPELEEPEPELEEQEEPKKTRGRAKKGQ